MKCLLSTSTSLDDIISFQIFDINIPKNKSLRRKYILELKNTFKALNLEDRFILGSLHITKRVTYTKDAGYHLLLKYITSPGFWSTPKRINKKYYLLPF